jgi:hypothetical protein
MAMIDQVDITPQRSFELIPKIGNTIIVLGDATNVEEKFYKLNKFYKDVMTKAGWNKYSVVDVQYKNQIVARRKDAKEVAADSMRTLQLMKIIADNAERMSADTLQVIVPDNERNTTNSNLIQTSIERDDDNVSNNTIEEPKPQGPPINQAAPQQPAITPVTRQEVTKPAAKPIVDRKEIVKPPAKNSKPAAKPTTTPIKLPKTVMPKKQTKPVVAKPQNDY